MQRKVIYCPQTNELAQFDLDNPNVLVNIYYQDGSSDEKGMVITVNFEGNNIEGLIKGQVEATKVLADLKNSDILGVDKIFVDPAAGMSDLSEPEDSEGEEEEDTNW